MQITRPARHLYLAATILLLLNACTTPQPANRYQVPETTTRSVSGPVAELHQNAISALARSNAKQAIDFLQRAIKIEPRNAFSWHYLAQSYWHGRDYRKCLAMIDRSESYSQSEDDLDRANQALQDQCHR